MSEQPKALRLAEILDEDYDESDLIAQEAAAELRRLHALCEEMGGALDGVLAIRSDSQGVAGYHLNGEVASWDYFDEVATAETALAKWRESK